MRFTKTQFRKLTEEVRSGLPGADGRAKYDAAKFKRWPVGTEFALELYDEPLPGMDGTSIRMIDVDIVTPDGARGRFSVVDTDVQRANAGAIVDCPRARTVARIMAASEVVTPGVNTIVRTSGFAYSSVVEGLIEAGKITIEDLMEVIDGIADGRLCNTDEEAA